MTLHPRLIAHRRSGSGQFLGESLVCAAAAMLLIGFALLPWHAGDSVQAAPSRQERAIGLVSGAIGRVDGVGSVWLGCGATVTCAQRRGPRPRGG